MVLSPVYEKLGTGNRLNKLKDQKGKKGRPLGLGIQADILRAYSSPAKVTSMWKQGKAVSEVLVG